MYDICAFDTQLTERKKLFCFFRAPNVYFNNLTVVNLDVELTRSRRISCSCCGLKGAALGCYNKSCKNSFHVTCAKLMPECRWDNVSVAYIIGALYSLLHSSFDTFSYQ